MISSSGHPRWWLQFSAGGRDFLYYDTLRVVGLVLAIVMFVVGILTHPPPRCIGGVLHVGGTDTHRQHTPPGPDMGPTWAGGPGC
uniref:FXYD domain-containing ion transport regulator n=1 Tax=Chelonoidis abingdonii TaxID=106734 RepID=A0A8C0H6B3_CHEAB